MFLPEVLSYPPRSMATLATNFVVFTVFIGRNHQLKIFSSIKDRSRQNEETITNDNRILTHKFGLECLQGLSGFDHSDQVCHVCNYMYLS